jgi:multicomponent K+:H+ antiporter subunit A
VTGVGALIFTYGRFYLGRGEDHPRFFASMLLFMGSMLGAVLSSNLIALFVFWELTSLSSFLLIGF